MTVELPRWTLADRLTVALVVAAGIVIEVVAAGPAGAPRGAGLTVAVGLLWWQARQRAGRPLALQLRPAGSAGTPGVRGGDCGTVHGASRVLGPSIVLHWQTAAGGRQAVWLTPLDLPRGTLRQLAVLLVIGRAVAP